MAEFKAKRLVLAYLSPLKTLFKSFLGVSSNIVNGVNGKTNMEPATCVS